MSIFSSIRKSREQAKEHKTKLAEQEKKENDDKKPYRHVPTHAAADAFASAPPSWREAADRPRIIEQNRRRSAMAATGHHMNMPGVPRIGSSLSYVSYPGPSGSGGEGIGHKPNMSSSSFSSVGRMRMPRSYSAVSISPYPDGNRNAIYTIPDIAHSEPATLENYSPGGSNTGSSSSQDDLEMPRVSRPPLSSRKTLTGPIPGPVSGPSSASKVHRLHPSNRSRRTSDASVDRIPPVAASSSSTRRAPQETRLHPPRSSSLYGPPSSFAHGPVSSASVSPENQVPPPESTSREAAHADTLRSLEARQDPSPGAAPAHVEPSRDTTSHSSAPPNPAVRSGRFSEMDTTNSEKNDVRMKQEYGSEHQSRAGPEPVPSPHRAQSVIVNSFPEPASESRDPSPPAKAKSKKLVKGGGKLLKKNRRAD